KTVAVLVGSLRRDSINRKFAESLAKLAAGRLDFRFVEIGDLPLYNDDLWADPPQSVLRMKREVEAADAVLFVTPE
ncbi:NADPH-dependent FMN reductase, partial [Salmonella enterica]|uniref:NADPH-dependent FMN reductase n=1 Tax=Salmonella enterica TaxID=28901 RepID=UPI003CE76907